MGRDKNFGLAEIPREVFVVKRDADEILVVLAVRGGASLGLGGLKPPPPHKIEPSKK